MRLVLTHGRYALLDQLRTPIAWMFTVLLPAAMFGAFAVPFVAADQGGSIGATLQVLVFAMASVAVLQFGVGIAEERRSSWEQFVRTLPVSGRQRFAARVAVASLLATAGVLLALAVGVGFTALSIPADRWATIVAGLILGALPLAALGCALGYLLTPKAAVPACNLIFLSLSFLGGLILPPFMLPRAVQAASVWLPTRSWAEIVVAAGFGAPIPLDHVARLATWGVGLMLLALWAYRRDEGRRYR